MRLTAKNHREMALLGHYATVKAAITPEDAKAYFDWSDRGIGADKLLARITEESRTKQFTGLSTLYYAKRNRDLAITSYREDWGSITALDFVDEPREVAEFVAKALGKPAIMSFWKSHHNEELTSQDEELLMSLGVFRELEK